MWTGLVQVEGLKVVSVTIFLVCFVSLKESDFKTTKNVYFTWKAFFVLEIIKF